MPRNEIRFFSAKKYRKDGKWIIPYDVTGKRELFIDDLLIDRKRNAGLKLHHPFEPQKSGVHMLDSQNAVFYSECEKCYVMYLRVWKTADGLTGLRSFAKTTSGDFLHWSKFEFLTVSRKDEHLPGFTFRDMEPFWGDRIGWEPEWNGGKFSDLPGGRFRLRLRMKECDLFSIHFPKE